MPLYTSILLFFVEISEACIITRTAAILSCIDRIVIINFIGYVSFFYEFKSISPESCNASAYHPKSHYYVRIKLEFSHVSFVEKSLVLYVFKYTLKVSVTVIKHTVYLILEKTT